MANMSDYLEQLVLNRIFGNGGAWSAPTGLQVALYSAMSGDGTGATELTAAGGYSRKNVTFGAAASGECLTSGSLTWTATGAAFNAPVSHYGVVDGSGNILYFGTLAATINQDETLTVATGGLRIALAGANSATSRLSTTLAHEILEATLRGNATLTQRTSSAFVSALSAFTDPSTLTEINDAGMGARKQITFGSVASGAVDNSAEISWGAATGAQTVVGVGIYSVATIGSGTLLMASPLTGGSKAVAAGKVFKFAVGALDVTLQ
jgi:hypothetical protein